MGRRGGVVEDKIVNLSQKWAESFIYITVSVWRITVCISAFQYLFKSGSVKLPVRLRGASTVLCVISGNIPALRKCYILFIAKFLY